jgi:hypothetical protein
MDGQVKEGCESESLVRFASSGRCQLTALYGRLGRTHSVHRLGGQLQRFSSRYWRSKLKLCPAIQTVRNQLCVFKVHRRVHQHPFKHPVHCTRSLRLLSAAEKRGPVTICCDDGGPGGDRTGKCWFPCDGQLLLRATREGNMTDALQLIT